MSEIAARLRGELGAEAVRSEPDVLARHRRDTWVLSELRDLEGKAFATPACVAEPASAAEVAAVLRVCREARVPIVPYGGGSGVCGGVLAPEGAVMLSTRRLEGLVSLDDGDLLATFRAGTNGLAAERCVQQAALTIGHWPQSIELSTVGGWVATRAAGQFSTAYGNVEDVLLALEAVLPDGTVVRTRQTPRASAGPDLRQIFLGSEGTLGVVTEVSFSLRAQPERSQGQALHFASFEDGLAAIRLLMRADWRPPVVRLYDPAESKRTFGASCPEGRALLLLLHEGPAAAVEAALAGVTRIGDGLAAGTAPAAAVEQWLEHRNRVPGFRSFLERGIVLDTIEVGALWSRVAEVYGRVVASLREVEGILTASAHSSHSYRSGTNLYFTFAARPAEATRMAEIYRECWRRTMEATLAAGGGIAHHHGIGRVRRDALAGELGAGGLALLRTLKRALDPDGLLNPGVLLPDA